jgi:MFS family permease
MSLAIIPMAKEFEWGHTTQGIVLSSFFWGYIWTQVPGGLLAKRLGGKVTFGFAIVGSCFCTILLPLLDFNFALLICCRICTGLCSAFAYPTVQHNISD